MKRLSIYMLAAGMAALSTSCSDFLDTVPKDQLAPSTTWQTEADAKGFIVGCYKDLLDGNTLLYQKIANEINRTSLDIRIGIVHAAGSRPESLNLDLADLFKPIIVDRTIFTLINRNMLDAEDFVEVEKNGIYLSGKGKKQFIQEFERKLYQKIQIDGCDRTYDFVIKSEIQKLKKFIETGEKYKPYKYV